MKRFELIVNGIVQGVGFRFFAQINAKTCSLTGFVKNLDNGDVLIEVQGDIENINKFSSIIKSGNKFIKVNNLYIKELKVNLKEKKFKVQY